MIPGMKAPAVAREEALGEVQEVVLEAAVRVGEALAVAQAEDQAVARVEATPPTATPLLTTPQEQTIPDHRKPSIKARNLWLWNKN